MNPVIDKEELRSLMKINPVRGLFQIVFEWGAIFALATAGEWSFAQLPFEVSLPLYVLILLLIGTRFHALGVLMHEATHYRILKNKKINDIIGEVLLAWPLLTTMYSYRKNHFAHHRHVNTDKDPDWLRRVDDHDHDFPKSRSDFFITCARYLFGFNIIEEIRKAAVMNKNNPAPTNIRFSRIALYALLVGSSIIFGFWHCLILYWGLPFFTAFFLIMYIRGVAEHYGSMEYENALNHTRHTEANWLEKILFAPNNVHYHLDHHLYPAVPFYNLPKLHKLLMQNEEYKEKAHITDGYFKGLVDECTREWDRDRV